MEPTASDVKQYYEKERKRLYDAAIATSLKASQQMWKYILIVLGVMIYIASVVLANVFYFPNYRACMMQSGTLWTLANSIVQALFIIFLVTFVARKCVNISDFKDKMAVEFLQMFDEYSPHAMGVLTLFLVFSYGVLFFRCRNPINCRECSPAQATAFNTLVTTQVNRGTPMLKMLQDFYTENMKQGRVPISTCANYYSSAFRQEGDGKITCQISEGEEPVCVHTAYVTNSEDAVQTGPLLSQFFIMTSGRTCVVSNQYDSYMSPFMIKLALDAGARCLDFDITNYSYAKNSFPIVTISRDYDKRNLQHNCVLFEDAMRVLSTEWLKNQTGATKRDPLFVRLSFDKGVTSDCMDQIAYLLQFYLNEQHGNHLLPVQWNYKSVRNDGGLGMYPICTFFDYIVIMVKSPHRDLSPLLDGMVNILWTKYDVENSFDNVTWSDVKNTDTNDRIEFNRLKLTYVETSFFPYSIVGHRKQPVHSNSKRPFLDDSLSTLIMNKQTINNSPMPAFVSGCQFIAMNLQNLDNDLKLYLSVFEKSSFIIKPKKMWASNMLTVPLQPNTLCDKERYTAYTKQTVDKVHCYEVCLPKSGTLINGKVTTSAMEQAYGQALVTQGYKRLEDMDNACARADIYQENPIAFDTEKMDDGTLLPRKEFNK